MSQNPVILILEDDPVTALIFEKTILSSLPECRPIWAKDIADARARAGAVAVHLFVIDVNLPDGSGLEFLWEMSSMYPESHAVVMSAMPRPEYEAESVALGALRSLPKPIAAAELASVLKDLLSSEQAVEGGAFRASLKNLSFFDIVQIKCLSGTSSTLQFSSAGRFGEIHIVDGEIVEARCGNVTGMDALHQIARWQAGMAHEVSLRHNGPRAINVGWQGLIMDLAHHMDEAQSE